MSRSLTVAGRPRADEIDENRDFGDYYTAAWGRTVAYLVPFTASRSEAEDLAQEAFSRLLPRWDRVGRDGPPDAWIRSVAYRLAVSRWRRMRSAKHFLAKQHGVAVEPPSDDVLTVVETLRPLSPAHRQVLMLHHGLGLSIEEIASELDIPPGTVKSRLSRARAEALLHREQQG